MKKASASQSLIKYFHSHSTLLGPELNQGIYESSISTP
jgi:hypothetical protein